MSYQTVYNSVKAVYNSVRTNLIRVIWSDLLPCVLTQHRFDHSKDVVEPCRHIDNEDTV
jgi:hypothetical protein